MATQPPETTVAHYLSFMFTLLVGELKLFVLVCRVMCVALFTGGMLGYTQEELKSMESQPSPESRLLKDYIALKQAQSSCQLYCNSPIILPTGIRSCFSNYCRVSMCKYIVTILCVIVIAVFQLNW